MSTIFCHEFHDAAEPQPKTAKGMPRKKLTDTTEKLQNNRHEFHELSSQGPPAATVFVRVPQENASVPVWYSINN
jgi:hypothetical protein